jgi:hypothetical protein
VFFSELLGLFFEVKDVGRRGGFRQRRIFLFQFAASFQRISVYLRFRGAWLDLRLLLLRLIYVLDRWCDDLIEEEMIESIEELCDFACECDHLNKRKVTIWR